MRRHRLIETVVAAGVVALWGGYAHADDASKFSASLSGFEELGGLNAQTGAILSDGTGTVSLKLNEKTGSIDWTLTYSKVGTTLPLTGTVTQAHIHFGKEHDSGNVLVYFCTNLSFTGHTGPTPQPCPLNSGTVTGTFTGANVQAIPTQNVSVGDFNALEDAITSNTVYANVHTTALGAGEIRGQIGRGGQGDK